MTKSPNTQVVLRRTTESRNLAIERKKARKSREGWEKKKKSSVGEVPSFQYGNVRSKKTRVQGKLGAAVILGGDKNAEKKTRREVWGALHLRNKKPLYHRLGRGCQIDAPKPKGVCNRRA